MLIAAIILLVAVLIYVIIRVRAAGLVVLLALANVSPRPYEPIPPREPPNCPQPHFMCTWEPYAGGAGP